MKILLFFLDLFWEGIKAFGMAMALILAIAVAFALAFGPAGVAIEMFDAGHYFYGTVAALIGIMIYGAGFKYT